MKSLQICCHAKTIPLKVPFFIHPVDRFKQFSYNSRPLTWEERNKEGIDDEEKMKLALQTDNVNLDKVIAYRGDIYIVDTEKYLPWLKDNLEKLRSW